MTQTDRPELVFGVVAGTGAPLDGLIDDLRRELAPFGYNLVQIVLSEQLKGFVEWTQPPSDELGRVAHLQKLGLAIRQKASDGGILARAALAKIREYRIEKTGKPDLPVIATAYVIRQIKHPDEVELLRRVYGPAFLLIGGHLARAAREEALARKSAEQALKTDWEPFRETARKIVDADEKEDHEFGQNTRDAFPQSDLFVDLRPTHSRASVARFVELVFGHPFLSPDPDEHSMFQAHAVSLRSSDFNRQVGAAIVRLAKNDANSPRIVSADVVAVGMNEVPRRGGGYYWRDDSPDSRDQNLGMDGKDRPETLKAVVLEQLLVRLEKRGLLSEAAKATGATDLARQLLDPLRGTHFMNIAEFSRPVHAEMAALLDAARRGVAVDGESMFVTTFPCHNCAKHIIAAGIKRVIYVEPYPKSRAGFLYQEEIVLEARNYVDAQGRVVFSAFTGIGPRLYARLFGMADRGAKRGITLQKWNATKATLEPVLVPTQSSTRSVAVERAELRLLDQKMFEWNEKEICP